MKLLKNMDGAKRLSVMEKTKGSLLMRWQTVCKVGRDDPRRVIHALKVGLALTMVSLLYLMEPLFEGIGQNAIWAVMTVVVVLEFTAGATLCKGLNRGLGTLLAGSLAFFIEYIATESTRTFRAIFIGVAVFVLGGAATYVRFVPYIKKNYDYGVLIFLLTFNLITVSSFRVHNVLKIAHERFYTIAIGCAICLLMALLIFPNWSGQDLHDNTVFKLQGLAKSIEACVDEYFKESDAKDQLNKDISSEDQIYTGYKAVLESKSIDETLALHASWEPRHSRHCYRFPSQQYVKIGTVLRHFAYTVVALHGCLQTEIQTPRSIRALFKDPCISVAKEVSKVLMELSNSIKNRTHCSPMLLSDQLHQALNDLNTALKSQPRLFLVRSNRKKCTSKVHQDRVSLLSTVKTDSSALHESRSNWAASNFGSERKTLRPTLSKIASTSIEFSEALPFAAFASLLVEMVAKLDNVIEEVEELGRIGCFKECEVDHEEVGVVVVKCEGDRRGKDVNMHNHLPCHGAD